MSATLTIMKNTFHDAVVKYAGIHDDPNTSISTTLKLTDLQLPNETLADVNIAGIMVTGGGNADCRIDRGGINIIELTGFSGVVMDLRGDPFPPDSTNNKDDIVLTLGSDQCEFWVFFKKVNHRIITNDMWDVPI